MNANIHVVVHKDLHEINLLNVKKKKKKKTILAEFPPSAEQGFQNLYEFHATFFVTGEDV
jgi:hypothetical protein